MGGTWGQAWQVWPSPQVPFRGPEPRVGRKRRAAGSMLPMPPSTRSPTVSRAGGWGHPVTWGLFLNNGPRDPVTSGGLGGQGDKGPLLTNGQRAGQHRALALCCRGGLWWESSSSIPVLCPPLGGDAGPPSCAVAEHGTQGLRWRSSVRLHPWGGVEGLLLSPQEDTGSGWPQGSGGALDSGWVGGSRS